MEYYKCNSCKTTNKKLWRDYESCCFNLTCYKCSGETRDIDAVGTVENITFKCKTDQIASKVPAIPVFDSEVEEYWGYTSVPAEAVEWWKKLPSK